MVTPHELSPLPCHPLPEPLLIAQIMFPRWDSLAARINFFHLTELSLQVLWGWFRHPACGGYRSRAHSLPCSVPVGWRLRGPGLGPASPPGRSLLCSPGQMPFLLLDSSALGGRTAGSLKLSWPEKGASVLGLLTLFILLSLGILFAVDVSGLMAVPETVGSD